MIDAKSFVWDDAKIKEWVKYSIDKYFGEGWTGYEKELEQFKQEQLKSKRDWEILKFRHKVTGAIDDISQKLDKVNPDWWLNCIEQCWEIHSVRRLSDGEVFELHKTRVVDPNTEHEWVISEINVGKDGRLFFNGVNITHVQKAKQPLFTTEDGVEIFESDIYFAVNSNFNHSGRSNGLTWYKPELGEKYFSTFEAAEDYIIMNKPVLSMTDVINADCLVDSNRAFYNLQQKVKQKLNIEYRQTTKEQLTTAHTENIPQT